MKRSTICTSPHSLSATPSPNFFAIEICHRLYLYGNMDQSVVGIRPFVSQSALQLLTLSCSRRFRVYVKTDKKQSLPWQKQLGRNIIPPMCLQKSCLTLLDLVKINTQELLIIQIYQHILLLVIFVIRLVVESNISVHLPLISKHSRVFLVQIRRLGSNSPIIWNRASYDTRFASSVTNSVAVQASTPGWHNPRAR